MAHYLSDEELTRTAPAEVAAFASPVPTQIVSNGEFIPLPQTRDQQRVEARIKELADDLGPRHGMNRRQFLASSAGMAAAFLAMNEVFGPVFDVSTAEARDVAALIRLVREQKIKALFVENMTNPGLVDQIADFLVMTNVGVDEGGFGAEAAKFTFKGFAFRIPSAGDHNARALLGEGEGEKFIH